MEIKKICRKCRTVYYTKSHAYTMQVSACCVKCVNAKEYTNPDYVPSMWLGCKCSCVQCAQKDCPGCLKFNSNLKVVTEQSRI